ncbi:hypothetical protein MJO29_011946 [Puccinia striiformis f. sp. tritici]|uniref:Uncharacterized protein n=3 Tax=Puccinia striiformis TaxID=27350 RepID=A0A0L0VQF6_9BASI|nr:hypothetical protein Pst134EA_022627 [Puccinia striiformis f. sp. tritici]KAI9605789.1 hypothetical protein H4Q26_004157 [Puccinia striiformis f. sp. tritici PST-130]KNF01499.1 hypothetical protein PSTG_05279 [Puccinia striiformis f. sp. tritici PST-78]POW17749.1 hypothetical protein PSTT_00403 [Puccinia striiformis]KAH9445672.1 hypothetical protein Pst134EB_023509 [Puccinia striiformis f. sp. tritici]KAH9455149.1 hypothetical protein Pst134EA_022627 [Puccinia striiformis f. sp. tritici]
MSLLRLLVVLACSTTLGVYAADPKTTVEFQCSAGRPNGWCAIKDPNKHSYMMTGANMPANQKGKLGYNCIGKGESKWCCPLSFRPDSKGNTPIITLQETCRIKT